METFSISNSMSKGSVFESDSILKAYQDDAASRIAGDAPEAISNEQICRGDELLRTYRVEADAIHGGMGSVWRVHHESWNTDLAMKRPQPRFFAEAGARRKQEFIAECEHWINLGLHPNIVSCYYVREIGGVPTVFSEWMDGGSLADAIRSGRLYGGAPEAVQERILDIAMQSARGLRYSHDQGLIHQDVKPGNILLTADWEAKAADFGLAKAQSRLGGANAPLSSGYTLEYCPREQAGGAAAEAWMDVYAWALTVVEMYAGGRLWNTGAEAKDILSRYEGELRAAMPGDVRALLRLCLEGGDAVDFAGVCDRLEGIYREQAGAPYPRRTPRAVGRTAEHMNNCALSFLDLGKAEAALALWEEAEAADSRCLAAAYNAALYRYRQGLTDDVAAVAAVKKLAEAGGPEGLLALARIQLECRSAELTGTLDRIEAQGGECAAELAEMRERARENGLQRFYSWDTSDTGPVDVSPDGRFILRHESGRGTRTESLILYGIEDREPISTMIREPDNGPPAEVRARFSRNSERVFGLYQKDPFLYKWRASDGEQLIASVMRKLPGESIMAFDYDARGERCVMASNRGRVVFGYPEQQISKPFGSVNGHFGVGITAKGDRGLVFCTEENRVVIRGFDGDSALEIPVEAPCFAAFAMEDSCVLAIQGGDHPHICLFDVQSGSRRYALPFPRMHEFTGRQGQFSISLDGRRLLLAGNEGPMLFDIPGHRWLFTITQAQTGESVNAVFRSFLTGAGDCVFISSYLSGLTGYRIPEFTQDSAWTLSVVHSTRENLAQEDAFKDLCGQARAALDSGDIARVLACAGEAADIAEGKFRSSKTYVALMQAVSARCAISEVGNPIALRTVAAFPSQVSSLSVSPSGRWVAALSREGGLAIWEAGADRLAYVDRLRRHLSLKPLRWAGDTLYSLAEERRPADGKAPAMGRLAGGGSFGVSFLGQSLSDTSGGRVYAFDLGQGAELTPEALAARFDGMPPAIPMENVTDFAVLEDGASFLYRRNDGPVCRYSPEQGTRFLLQVGEECQVSGMAVSPDGRIGLQVCGDIMNFSRQDTSWSRAVFFDVQTGKALYGADGVGATSACAFTGDGLHAVIGNTAFDLRSGRRYSLNVNGSSLAGFLEGRYVVGLGGDSRLRVLRPEDGTVLRDVDVGEEPTALACSPDGCRLYVGNGKGGITELFWDHRYEPGDARPAGNAAAAGYFWRNAPDEGGGRPDPPSASKPAEDRKRRGIFGLFSRRDRH